MNRKIGLGGGCHWCTEAIFQSLIGVSDVQQGWISSKEAPSYSEAILLNIDEDILPLGILIGIHLATHSCTSAHKMRYRYRSAIYVFSEEEKSAVDKILLRFKEDYSKKIITRVLQFRDFKLNSEEYLNYYYKDPDKPFCRNVIDPKLKTLLRDYNNWIDPTKLVLP